MPEPDEQTPAADRFSWVTRRKAPERIPRQVIERFDRLEDLSSTVSDVLDQLGLIGAIGASRLKPSLPEKRVIGPALTVRNVEQRRSASTAAADNEWKMAEILAVVEAKPGDVLLFQGVHDTSNMGGLLATIAQREGIIGAVVDGGVRDVGHSRKIGLPIWSADVSPVTGKWRCITEEINGVVNLAGVTVAAGDLVIADETGICVVPRERAEEVLERCEAITRAEAAVEADIAAGVPLTDLMERLYGDKKG